MLVVIAGVSGSGKTSIGEMLAKRLPADYADADSFHTEKNLQKMASGIPLTEADRGPWLEAIATWIDGRLADGESGVISCSCLKRRYRERLLSERPSIRMVFLSVDEETVRERLTERRGHFFPMGLIASQFDELEEPSATEPTLSIDGTRSKQEVVDSILTALGAM